MLVMVMMMMTIKWRKTIKKNGVGDDDDHTDATAADDGDDDNDPNDGDDGDNDAVANNNDDDKNDDAANNNDNDIDGAPPRWHPPTS